MHKARFVTAYMFCQMGQKSDHIMLGDSFNLVDARYVECDVLGFPNRLGIGAWYHAQIGLCVTGVGFDLVPDPELGLWRPDGNHVGAGVAGNHTKSLLSCLEDAPIIPLLDQRHKVQRVAAVHLGRSLKAPELSELNPNTLAYFWVCFSALKSRDRRIRHFRLASLRCGSTDCISPAGQSVPASRF